MRTFKSALCSLLLSVPALLLTASALNAQTVTSRDSLRGVYRHYDFNLETPDTPAPKGYKAFYISHYGRHGSRYPVDRDYLMNIAVTLKPIDDAGLLSKEGKAILRDTERLDSICMAGTYGDLSPQGAYEHRTIAAHMAERWSSVFGIKGRNHVDVYSSYVPRCIHSMQNFTASLSEKYTDLTYSIDTTEASYAWLVNNRGTKKASFAARLSVEEAWDDSIWQDFYARIFTDPDAALKLVRSRYLLCEFIYTNASMVPLYAPESGIDLMSVFTDKEFETIYRAYNDKTWGGHGNSAANGKWRIHRMDSLLVRYVADADAVISAFDNGHKRDAAVATLRFGHDTSLMPLLSLMGVKDYHEQVPAVGATEMFNSSVDMTMAANLMMVFYRNRKGDVLVKFVHSGRETTIPALTPVTGPYYRWNDVRAWFLSRAGRAEN